MEPVLTNSLGRSRDSTFRERVLIAYEYCCAICGFDVKLTNIPIGLEAAHIMWHQAGGPETEDNGLALCSLHHKLFDRGAFTISRDYKIHISQKIHGSSGVIDWLLRHHNEQIRKPQHPSYYANQDYLRWHRSEVFKGPPRYITHSNTR